MNLRLRQCVRVRAMIGAVAFVSAAAIAAQAPPMGEPFAIESSALVPLDDEKSVAIVGIHGQVTVAVRDERELRVISRAPGLDGGALPIGIWQDGSNLSVAPAPGDEGLARQVHVEVPKGFAIAVDATDSDVVIQSDGGGIDLHGTNLRATIRAPGGSIVADLDGGTLTVRESRDATVRFRRTAVTIGAMSGNVTVHAVGGTLALTEIDGSTDIESEDTRLVLDGLSGSLRVTAKKGDARVLGIQAGANLSLAGTPLRLKNGMGDINVTSDATVEFQAMAAALHFDMYGGSLRGKGNQGILEVRTRNTEVNVESILEGMRIQGDGLKARIVDVGGELYVETTNSDVFIERAVSVVLQLDRGSATVRQTVDAVQADVTGADVHILDGSGPVFLEMDGGDGEVSWAVISGEKESTLINTSGNLTVRFPVAGGCRVEAESKYGRVDSEIPTVKVSDDFDSARGAVNGVSRPFVHIIASGDIFLQNAPKTP